MHVFASFAAYVVFTLISGAAQDMLYTSYKFYETDAMSLVQSLVLFGLGAVSYAIRESGMSKHCQPHAPKASPNSYNTGNPCTRVPAHMQLTLGISIAGNVLLTNYATEFLSFPVQVVFKSAKLLIAMFVRAVIFRRPNKRIDYYCATMLSLGLIGFMWPSGSHADKQEEGGMDETSKFTIGLICVVGSLVAEAIMLNVQEVYLFQRYEVSTEWVMMFGYLYSSASQAVLLALLGTFGRTMSLLASLSSEIMSLLIAFPVFMWIGVTFLLILVKDHGAVPASAANVVRKAIAVAFSFLYYGREITTPIAVGGLLVFGSIVWRGMSGEGHGDKHAEKHDTKGHSSVPATARAVTSSDSSVSVDVESDPMGSAALFEGTPRPGVMATPTIIASVIDEDTNPIESEVNSPFFEVDMETQPLTGLRKTVSRTPARTSRL